MDKANINELIKFILQSINLIKNRFEPINSSDDFLENDDGLMRLDSISMRLQAIGESVKNLHKRDKEFLLKVANEKYWRNIIKTREVLSHHYIDIDSEIIFMICDEKLYELEKYVMDLEKFL